ncbi:MAG TPA: methylmalonyl-CoA mutase, partial [Thermoplasmata archaeon]|nr:methylmalonyl-CoA mutase [Thermoplasmata archaeon]
MSDPEDSAEYEARLRKWEATTLKDTLKALPERRKEFVTTSSRPVKRLYTPLDVRGTSHDERLGSPGEYPFTRGVHPTMYRGRLWTMRQ